MKTISFKVTDEEARIIRGTARNEKMSVSEFLRQRAAGKGTRSKVEKVRCRFKGAEILAPVAIAQPFTTESVREMLAEFP